MLTVVRSSVGKTKQDIIRRDVYFAPALFELLQIINYSPEIDRLVKIAEVSFNFSQVCAS